MAREEVGEFRYRLKNTGSSSAKYGLCEVCRTHCAEMWMQTEQRKASDPDGTFWTYWKTSSLFGHKKCLISARRSGMVVNQSEKGERT